jgi:hypothetical protein
VHRETASSLGAYPHFAQSSTVANGDDELFHCFKSGASVLVSES